MHLGLVVVGIAALAASYGLARQQAIDQQNQQHVKVAQDNIRHIRNATETIEETLEGVEINNHGQHVESDTAAAETPKVVTAQQVLPTVQSLPKAAAKAEAAILQLRSAGYPTAQLEKDLIHSINAAQPELTEVIENVRDVASMGAETAIDNLAVIQRKYD